MTSTTTPSVRAPKRPSRLRTTGGVALLAGLVLALIGAAPAHAAQIQADPVEIVVGESTAITATDLGDLETAYFGLSDTSAGTFAQSGASSYAAPVTGGTATATFTASAPGTVTIAVGSGETVLSTIEVIVDSAPAPAPAPADGAAIVLSPDAVEVGEATTVRITGLGGLETAYVGLGDPDAGTFSPGDSSQVSLAVSDGSATATFTPSVAGDVTIAVGDGETVLATAVLAVTAASSAEPTPTVTAVPISAPTQPDNSALLWIIVALAAVIVIGAIVWIVTARRRARSRAEAR